MQSNRLTQRFAGVDGENRLRMGFVLASGNFGKIGKILKLNNILASAVSHVKSDLIGASIEVLMPPSF
jgi:hypothetical protein